MRDRCENGHWLDRKGVCWNCQYRRCEVCGRSTGSELLALCIICDLGGSHVCDSAGVLGGGLCVPGVARESEVLTLEIETKVLQKEGQP